MPGNSTLYTDTGSERTVSAANYSPLSRVTRRAPRDSHRPHQPRTLKERPSELLRSCAPHRAQQPDYITAWIISWIPSTLPNAAAFDRRCVWWMKKDEGSRASPDARTDGGRHTCTPQKGHDAPQAQPSLGRWGDITVSSGDHACSPLLQIHTLDESLPHAWHIYSCCA